MRRITRLLLWTAGAILALVLLTAAVTETTFFKQWLRGLIVRQANQHLNGTLSIGQLRGSLFSGIELDQVALQMDNQPLVSIDAVKVAYNIRALVSGGTTVESVSLVHPVVAVRRDGDGWQFGRLVKKDAQEADRRGPNRAIAIRHITITDGSFVVDKPQGKQAVNLPRTFDKFNAALSFSYAPVHYTIAIVHMSFEGADPQLTLNEVSGAVTVKDDNINLANLTVRTSETAAWADGAIAYRHGPMLALQVSLNPISLPEIHRLVPAMKEMNVRPNVNLKLSGPTSRLATEISVRSDAVDASAKGTIGIGGGPDRIFEGEIAVHHLDLAPFLNNPEQKSDINVYAKANLRGPAGFDSLKGTVAADAPLVSTHGYVVEGIQGQREDRRPDDQLRLVRARVQIEYDLGRLRRLRERREASHPLRLPRSRERRGRRVSAGATARAAGRDEADGELPRADRDSARARLASRRRCDPRPVHCRRCGHRRWRKDDIRVRPRPRAVHGRHGRCQRRPETHRRRVQLQRPHESALQDAACRACERVRRWHRTRDDEVEGERNADRLVGVRRTVSRDDVRRDTGRRRAAHHGERAGRQGRRRARRQYAEPRGRRHRPCRHRHHVPSHLERHGPRLGRRQRDRGPGAVDRRPCRR